MTVTEVSTRETKTSCLYLTRQKNRFGPYCFLHLRLFAQELVNCLTTRQFVGTDKLISDFTDFQIKSGETALLTL